MQKSFEIDSDCLDIIKRIKELDKDYYVIFNIDKKVFELHNRSQAGNTYCLTIDYDCLDERAYNLVLKTRANNFDALFEEMEKENKKLVQRQTKEVLSDFEEKFYDS